MRRTQKFSTARLRHRVGGRLAGAVGTRELVDLHASVASLEVAVPENAALEAPLEALVSDLERTVADVLARRHGMGA